MNAVRFPFLISVLVLLLVGLLGITVYTSPNDASYNMLLGWLLFNQLGPLWLFGIGVGLPVFCLAALFGWIQMILIANGNIPPHLSSKGFLEALSAMLTVAK